MLPSKLLQKKTKRENYQEETPSNNEDVVIMINQPNFSLNQTNNIQNFYKPINIKKSDIIEKIEKSGKIYDKCPYNNSNINYKIEKINLDIPIIPKICSKPILLANLIYFKDKCFLFIGHSFNLMAYEIKGNDSFFISSVFDVNIFDNFVEDIIDKIYFLNYNISPDKIQFVIIGKIINLYEFNFSEKEFINRKNIFINDTNSDNYKYKLIKLSSKLVIYDEKNIKIYDFFNNKNPNFEITLGDSEDNIKSIQNFSNNLIIIITDNFLIIYDFISESIIYKIPKKLQFGEEKILLLNDNKFLLYCDNSATIYDYNFSKKFEKPQVNIKLDLNNIKNIKKILQVKNNDLIIFYENFNFAVFDLKYNFIKYKKIGKELNYACNNLFPKEIQSNIIAYKTDLYNINFIDIIKGEILGSFGFKKNNILSFKKIEKYFINEETAKNNDKIYYFILAGKSSYILSN